MANLHVVMMIVTVWFLYAAPEIHGWGKDGHEIICKIAQTRLNKNAVKAVKQLISTTNGDLSSLCSWADSVTVRNEYPWSSPLHYINTPDRACSYEYNSDCKDESGMKDNCVAGAINNYTTRLLTYNTPASSKLKYDSTEDLLFLSHFMGDIHQPLHVGHTTDKGGNTIEVNWYTRKTNLHHIWDSDIIQKAVKDFYNSNQEQMVNAIKKDIRKQWADEVTKWESCPDKLTACPDIYASEGIKYACDFAYKGVTEKKVTKGDTLKDTYFNSRLPIVSRRLAQGGVRLAATLNRIFP